jgi:hypothetical protein
MNPFQLNSFASSVYSCFPYPLPSLRIPRLLVEQAEPPYTTMDLKMDSRSKEPGYGTAKSHKAIQSRTEAHSLKMPSDAHTRLSYLSKLADAAFVDIELGHGDQRTAAAPARRRRSPVQETEENPFSNCNRCFAVLMAVLVILNTVGWIAIVVMKARRISWQASGQWGGRGLK